jgi:hypothetical protein
MLLFDEFFKQTILYFVPLLSVFIKFDTSNSKTLLDPGAFILSPVVKLETTI